MSQQLNPYLTFPGTAAEAMAFYAEALGGTVQSMTFRESGMDEDGLMHAALETPAGFHIFASDTSQQMPMELIVGNNMQVSISGDDAEALRGYWAKLSDGAQITMPLEKAPWGAEYGLLTDKFGISWHVNIGG